MALAVLSVVAVWWLELRDAARDPALGAQPASAVVPQWWIQVLAGWRHRTAGPTWTCRDFVFALARLGGHQNRTGDGPPGWIVLWRGGSQLQSMIAGALAVNVPEM